MAVKKKGLGAKGLGLNALINTEIEEIKASKNEKKKTEEAVLELELDLIEPNKKQPRKYFDENALEELAASLKSYGMIQPIVVKKRLNPDLEIEGIVFTMFDARTNLSLQVVEEVKRSLGQNVYRTIIPRNVRLGESPSHGLPINLYDPKSKGAEAYALLAEEV
ncbi:MAG: ParB N-terminal domain-containing protein, partial [Anaerotignum sp.]|nr:ParB N-terminal domain-containing protein [Anaerotignum sp.]